MHNQITIDIKYLHSAEGFDKSCDRRTKSTKRNFPAPVGTICFLRTLCPTCLRVPALCLALIFSAAGISAHAADRPAEGEFSNQKIALNEQLTATAVTGNSAGDLFLIRRAAQGDTLLSLNGAPLFKDTLARIGATPEDDSETIATELGSYGSKIGPDTDSAAYLGQRKSISGESLAPASFVSTQCFVPASSESPKGGANNSGGALYSIWNTESDKAIASGLSVLGRLELTYSDSGWLAIPESSGMLDSSSIDGLFNVTNSGVTPWNSMILVESMPYTATGLWNHPAVSEGGSLPGIETTAIQSMNDYMMRESNPYRYGYLVELRNPADTFQLSSEADAQRPSFVRHYTSGRLSGGSFTFMADGRTLYRSDVESGLLFKFVADYAHNPAAGNLYVAALIPDYNENNGSGTTTGYNINWLWLAHGNNEAISAWIGEYEGMTEDDYVDGDTSYISVSAVQHWTEARTGIDLDEDGLISQVDDDRVAFLESVKASIALLKHTGSAQFYAVSSLSQDNESLLVALEKENCQYAFRGAADQTGNVSRLELLSSSTETAKSECDRGINGEFVLSQNSLFLLEPGIGYARIDDALHRIQY